MATPGCRACLLGNPPPESVWINGPPPSEPAAGKTRSVAIIQIEMDLGLGSWMRRQGTHRHTGLVARFSVPDAGQGKLSGCPCRNLPVEVRFKRGGIGLVRRWIFFPDLSFGLETKRDGVQIGLTAPTRS